MATKMDKQQLLEEARLASARADVEDGSYAEYLYHYARWCRYLAAQQEGEEQ